jgi:hypothetical protein
METEYPSSFCSHIPSETLNQRIIRILPVARYYIHLILIDGGIEPGAIIRISQNLV